MINTEITLGLCANCRSARLVTTKRGSSFLRCALSDEDAAYPKYPPLPVRSCDGHRPTAAAPIDATPSPRRS